MSLEIKADKALSMQIGSNLVEHQDHFNESFSVNNAGGSKLSATLHHFLPLHEFLEGKNERSFPTELAYLMIS